MKYNLDLTWTATYGTMVTIEADSLEDAMDKAREECNPRPDFLVENCELDIEESDDQGSDFSLDDNGWVN